jgi:hypothetical protein
MEYAKGFDVKLIESLKVFAVKFDDSPTEKKQLNTVIKNGTLGNVTFAGSTPTDAELKNLIKEKNSNVNDSYYTLSSITASSAVATGTGEYEGAVDISYSKAE